MVAGGGLASQQAGLSLAYPQTACQLFGTPKLECYGHSKQANYLNVLFEVAKKGQAHGPA